MHGRNARPPLAFLSAAAAFIASSAADPSTARAYTVASAISTGCHERITAEALREVRLELPTAAPLPADRNEQALIDDVEFPLPDDMRDLGATAMLLGVRDNDLKGRQSNDISELALVHGDPQLQREHCLRSSDDDEPDGSETALAHCRDFILERVAKAVDGLDPTGAPDSLQRTPLSVYLALRHRVDAPLPTFYVRMGQALHAVEDSFTHTYRSADGMQVDVVLNWVDGVNGGLVPEKDGPPHAGELDHCDDADDLRHQRRLLATDAATALLRAALDPDLDRSQKMDAASVVLDLYLAYAPGCTFDNDWCDAPEHKYGDAGLGCRIAGPPSSPGPAAIILAFAFTVTICARGRRQASGAGIAVLLAGLATTSRAAAEAPSPAGVDERGALVSAPTPIPAPPPPLTWGGYFGASGAVNNGGMAAAVGARLRVSKHWTFGLDAEWNPWFAINGDTRVRAGAFNGYATAILRIPLFYEHFDLRTTGKVGTSTLLIDLYGAPRGSTGVFVALSPLGIEWAVSSHLFIILDPLGYALPVPQLHGVPFAYPQYRATVGIELYGG